MRIAFISTSNIPSRTANSIQVLKVCQAFQKLGHAVKLWLPGNAPIQTWDEVASHYGISDPISIEWIRSSRLLKRYDFSIRALLAARSWKPDSYYVWPLQTAAAAATLRLPTLLEMHDRPQGRFGPTLFRRFINGRGKRRILPITKALNQWLSVTYDVKLMPPFSIVCPMGVDIDRYADLPSPAEARSQIGLEETFTAGYSGHFYPGRGIDLLYELALRNQDINFIWMGGEDKEIAYWRERVKAEGVENIHLRGFIPNEDLPLYQAACDALLMPYEKKITTSSGGDTAQFASPMKVFEYMAAGRVILSSDLPVFREVLNPSNSILLPPNDADAWTRALRSIKQDPHLGQILRHEAQKRSSTYSWVQRASRSMQGWDAI